MYPIYILTVNIYIESERNGLVNLRSRYDRLVLLRAQRERNAAYLQLTFIHKRADDDLHNYREQRRGIVLYYVINGQ